MNTWQALDPAEEHWPSLKHVEEPRLDCSKISNVCFENVNHRDAPDYTDAWVFSADYEGDPMTDDQLDALNDDDGLIHELIQKHLR